MSNHNEISSFIWNVCDDILRNVFKNHEYGDIILPFLVLRRLDCVLEPKKKEFLADAVDEEEAEHELGNDGSDTVTESEKSEQSDLESEIDFADGSSQGRAGSSAIYTIKESETVACVLPSRTLCVSR